MDQLQRTQSRESAKSSKTTGGGAHSLSSASSATSTSRKARSAENETTSNNVERPALSMPPPASRTVSRNFPSRRLSKASDSLLLLSPGIIDGHGDSPLLGQEDPGFIPSVSAAEGTYINQFPIFLFFLAPRPRESFVGNTTPSPSTSTHLLPHEAHQDALTIVCNPVQLCGRYGIRPCRRYHPPILLLAVLARLECLQPCQRSHQPFQSPALPRGFARASAARVPPG